MYHVDSEDYDGSGLSGPGAAFGVFGDQRRHDKPRDQADMFEQTVKCNEAFVPLHVPEIVRPERGDSSQHPERAGARTR